MKVRKSSLFSNPARQHFEVEQLAVGLRRPVVHLREHHQRMACPFAAAGDLEAFGVGRRQQPVCYQLLDDVTAIDPARWRLHRLRIE